MWPNPQEAVDLYLKLSYFLLFESEKSSSSKFKSQNEEVVLQKTVKVLFLSTKFVSRNFYDLNILVYICALHRKWSLPL